MQEVFLFPSGGFDYFIVFQIIAQVIGLCFPAVMQQRDISPEISYLGFPLIAGFVSLDAEAGPPKIGMAGDAGGFILITGIDLVAGKGDVLLLDGDAAFAQTSMESMLT